MRPRHLLGIRENGSEAPFQPQQPSLLLQRYNLGNDKNNDSEPEFHTKKRVARKIKFLDLHFGQEVSNIRVDLVHFVLQVLELANGPGMPASGPIGLSWMCTVICIPREENL